MKILFLCTGNSCRSQMAEGFARYYGSDLFEVYSAGISPAGINSLAIKVMEEVGIDISAQTSDPVDQEILDDVDLIITLCGNARESCPLVKGNTEKRHWPLKDPVQAEGSPEDILKTFRQVRDEVAIKVQNLVKEYKLISE